MADNVAITAGTGTTIGADEISSVKYQRVKVIVGADGTNDGDVCTANPLPISDAGGAITVDGTVAVTNAGITSIDGKITACNTGAVVLSSGTVTAVTSITNAVAVTNAGITSIDGKVTACNTGAVVLAAGTAEIGKLAAGVAEIGNVKNSGTFAVQEASAADIKTAVQLIDNAVDGNYLNTNMNIAGTDVDGNSGNKSAQTLRVVIATDQPQLTAKLLTTEDNSGSIKTAVELIDNAVYVDDADWTDDTSSHLLVGGVYQAAPHSVTTGDVAPISLNINGAVRVTTAGGALALPNIDSYTSDDVNVATGADNSIVAAPGANKQIWVYGLALTADVAGSFSLQDEDNTALTGVMPIGATGGFVMPISGNFSMPWFKVATNKALEIDCVTCTADGVITYAIVSV